MQPIFRYLCGAALLALTACAAPLGKKHLLVIGDSNGAGKGWVYHLQELRGGGPLVNTSLGGNTIGFNGMGELRRNTLENLTAYLRKGYAEMGQIDEILIGLGTNDCKAEYADRRADVYDNLDRLLTGVDEFFASRGQAVPRIVLLTPPPAGADDVVIGEFAGVSDCLAELAERIRTTAARRGHCLVDLQQQPGPGVLAYSRDGIHFNAEGYQQLAEAVVRACY